MPKQIRKAALRNAPSDPGSHTLPTQTDISQLRLGAVSSLCDHIKEESIRLVTMAKLLHTADLSHPVLELFRKIAKAGPASFYMTITYGKKQAATFGSDNWSYIMMFIADLFKQKQNHHLGIIIRRFEDAQHHKTKRPYKTIAGIRVTNQRIEFINRDEMRACHHTNCHTGQPLPESEWEEDLIFGDVRDLFPQWTDALVKE